MYPIAIPTNICSSVASDTEHCTSDTGVLDRQSACTAMSGMMIMLMMLACYADRKPIGNHRNTQTHRFGQCTVHQFNHIHSHSRNYIEIYTHIYVYRSKLPFIFELIRFLLAVTGHHLEIKLHWLPAEEPRFESKWPKNGFKNI